mmetsp:Transcript_10109/g.21098  ORF Transcript_10109/g.21098 Transcript_10109/m.21098 type:complete len:206 (-) Transcript_10109:134-751(-)|eukprot:CAMPEP_0197263406 /NCGR_PEP_ID=MMETSP1432-20130617/1142_1 /TAXON_ID=44447 /ORGANISM="Pseudo-nitzschia delicatissima, Strain UNC1205" /LENGTH=205 /DNA_ID=CAMNT_0042727889 /DNA_START=95 /DNA_END=712 /DNA_ORIENTATION=+
MKRHLISFDSSEKDDLKQCIKTSLTILGECRNMVGEDRDTTASHVSKRPKLESSQGKTSTTNVEENDRTTTTSEHNRFLDLVSSAVNLLAEKAKKQEAEQTPPAEASSEVTLASTTRGSRSNSISSLHSISPYRSYEMELPDQPHKECMKTRFLLRAPRFPTPTDGPLAQTGWQLSTRRYEERPAYIEGKTIENQRFQIQTVIYR